MNLLIAVLIVILIVIIMFIIQPFMNSHDNNKKTISNYSLLEQRTRIVESLHDLDFDHNTGKIETVDYHKNRRLLIREGIELSKQIDESIVSNI